MMMKMVAKGITGIVTSIAVGHVVENAIRTVTPQNATRVSKLWSAVGSVVIVALINEQAVRYMDAKVDGIWSAIESVRVAMKMAQQTTEEKKR